MIIWIKTPNQKERTASIEEIYSSVNNGTIDPNETYCWYEGIEDWVAVSTVIPPKPYHIASLPPTIPTSNLTNNTAPSSPIVNSPKTSNKSFREFAIFRHYSQISVFFVLFLVVMMFNGNAHSLSSGRDKDMASVLPTITGIVVYRRYLWDFCYLFRNLFSKCKALFLFLLYTIPFFVMGFLFVIPTILFYDNDTRTLGPALATCVFGWIFSIDIPINAKNKLEAETFKNGKSYSVAWSILGTIVLISVIAGIFGGVTSRINH